jgi:putative SOS response-associated peptidase YedK
MCGRYALHAQPEVIALQFGLEAAPALAPRYNVAPGTRILVVADGAPPRTEFLLWGLVAPWARGLEGEKGVIMARADSVAEKPMFRAAFRRQRCLVPASGYYEWQSLAGRRQPWYIRPADAPLFGLAGIYTLHRTEQGEAGTVALLTTGAGASTREIHDRMPVILRPEDYARWLDPATEAKALLGLLARLPTEAVACHPVSTRVNAAKNDDEACIAPL